MPESLPLHVLIVVDDTSARFAARAAVEGLDHLCSLAETGPEAVEILDADHPGVLVIRWHALGLDSASVVRRIREQSADRYVYVAAVTPPGDLAAARQAREAGADEVVAAALDAPQMEGVLISAKRVLALQAELRAGARVDPLTRVPNRRALSDDLAIMRLRVSRYGSNLAATLFDIDRFAAYHEAVGRPGADGLIRRLADTLCDSLRGSDSLYRYGDQQFLALLPDQDCESAASAAERLRATVEELAFPHPAGGLVTLSAGVAALHDGESAELFMTRLERAAREATEAGCNCVRATESWPHVQPRA